MKNLSRKLITLAAVSLMSVSAMAVDKSQEAVAVTLGYANNNVTGQDGLLAEAELRQLYQNNTNIRVGLSTLTDVDEGKLVSYGAYTSYEMPVSNTKFSVVPRVGVDYYDEDIDELFGHVALGLEYKLDNTVTVGTAAKWSESFDSSLDGESYTFTVTKVF